MVVVSEEEGKISLVREGRITRDLEAGVLRSTLQQLLVALMARTLRRATSNASPRRFAAASARSSSRRRRAFVMWFFVNAGERETQVLPFPVELRNLPERAVLTNADRVDTVSVRLNGPGPLLASLDTKRSPIILDLTNVEIGTDVRLKVRDEMVRVPRGVRILDIEPSRVPVRLEHVRRTSVPITLAPTGEPPRRLQGRGPHGRRRRRSWSRVRRASSTA